MDGCDKGRCRIGDGAGLYHAGRHVVGVIGASEVTTGVIALPQMLKRQYDKYIACGSILAGGTLGILIPPND